MALDEPKETDKSEEVDGIKYLIDAKLVEKLGTVSVDYVESGWRSGFVITTQNPIGVDRSSCGSCSC